MKYLGDSMDVKITKVSETAWKVTGHSDDDNGRHFDIGKIELVPFNTAESKKNLFLLFESDIAEAVNLEETESWLASRSFTVKEMRELADLMDNLAKELNIAYTQTA
jgi:hypothetical protein